jgi:hypothetical protein
MRVIWIIIAVFVVVSCSYPEEEDSLYTITFISSGGSSVASQTVEPGGVVIVPAQPNRDGYAFLYWRLLDGSESYDFNLPVTGDLVLVAVWELRMMFISIPSLSEWLHQQPLNRQGNEYRVGLRDIDLDAGNHWEQVGLLVQAANKEKYIDLDLRHCTGRSILDGNTDEDGRHHGIFSNSYRLTSIELPESLENVGEYAFYFCNGSHLFLYLRECNMLASLHLPTVSA